MSELLPGEKALYDRLEGEADTFIEGLSPTQEKEFQSFCAVYEGYVALFKNRIADLEDLADKQKRRISTLVAMLHIPKDSEPAEAEVEEPYVAGSLVRPQELPLRKSSLAGEDTIVEADE